MRGAFLAAAGAVAACGEDVTLLSVEPGFAPFVVLGTGEAEFVPLQGEPELRLVYGPQGGFHVWASFLAYGFSSPVLDLVLVTSLENQADSRLVMRARLTTREVLDASGTPARTFAGFPAQVKNARCADGQRVKLELELSEPDGSASDERYCIADVADALRLEDCP